MTQTNMTDNQGVIALIVSAISNTSTETVSALIDATNPLNGCRFVSLRRYSSDKTKNKEVADAIINIGFDYEAMKKTDAKMLAKVNLQNIDINTYEYNKIDTGVLTMREYKKAVQSNLNKALMDLIASNRATTISSINDIYLNSILVFNIKTNCLSILGQSISKKITVDAEEKIIKKSPLTVAKELIKNTAGLRTNTYRRFKIDNLGSVKISGETIIVQ